MSTTVQRWCLWCGPLMVVLWLSGFAFLAHFVVPPSPQASAAEIAGLYREHAFPIRLGLVLTTCGSALLGPFLTVISVQMQRIEGRFAPLAYLQWGLGALFVLEFIIPVMFMQVAAYRPDRSPEIVQTLNDIGWIMFVGIASTIVLELIAIGAAILLDRRATPIYPRWAGYQSIFTGLLIVPSNLVVFFHDGPLAWNGVFAWYLPISFFSIWVFSIMVLSFRAVSDQERQSPSAAQLSGEEMLARFEAMAAEIRWVKSMLEQRSTP